MVTGDSLGAARAVASAVGLPQEHVHAALLPADKLKQVRCCSGQTHACLGHLVMGCRSCCAFFLARASPLGACTDHTLPGHSLLCSKGRM